MTDKYIFLERASDDVLEAHETHCEYSVGIELLDSPELARERLRKMIADTVGHEYDSCSGLSESDFVIIKVVLP